MDTVIKEIMNHCELCFGLNLRLRGIPVMVRKLQKADIDRVADIWLDTNLKAHDFISAQYWKRNFELVKEMLLQAEVYVYESESENPGVYRA